MSITTAGSDRLGICYEVRGHLIENLDRTFMDETLFGIIYTLDDTDDWTLEENWIKANPNWGVSVEVETVINDGRRAIFTTHKQPSFMMKHLDLWVNSDQSLISARDWQACYTTSMDIEDFHSDPCVIGLDLASKLDLAASVKVFSRMEGGKKHLYLFGKYWLPAETIEKSSNPKYEGWAREKNLERSSGATNDFDVIEQELKQTASQFDVKAIAFDPWNAKQLGDHMMADGATMVEVRPLVQNFSPALKELLALIAERRIHHDGDPVMACAMSTGATRLQRSSDLQHPPDRRHRTSPTYLSVLARTARQQPTRLRSSDAAPRIPHSVWSDSGTQTSARTQVELEPAQECVQQTSINSQSPN